MYLESIVARKMASKKCSLILVVLFICLLSFSSKALARNIPNASKLYLYEIGLNKKRLLASVKPKPDNARGHNYADLNKKRLLSEKCGSRTHQPHADRPRCHNYL
ncbi:uncharacterized protein [Medicago truncatula]|uniref:uncharacterized protein isoform X2 n=1 Tax=Medicago truncatula TaxID=3880 RepID=UPI001968194C|nr:uncharacterized protein LOC25491959 isoform X2 [Medicago truncatula]